MEDLNGLIEMGVVLNPPYMGEWPFLVGQYMLNFGAIELLSFQHLNFLEANRADFNKNLDRLLAARIDRILVLINQSQKISDLDKVEIISLWQDAKELAQWRNRIAHNPVLPTWKPGSDSEHSPPDLLGIPDMRQLKSSNVSDAISPQGMKQLIDASAKLGQRIHDVAKTLKLTGRGDG